jgi:probable HAF family extracellular repeat protein
MYFDPYKQFVLLFLSLSAISAGTIHFTVTDLGTLGGATSSASAVNASGQTAGSATTAGGLGRATLSGADITPSGAQNASAFGINASGQVAGTVYINDVPNATVWSGGTAHYLSDNSFATGINDAGQVTGMLCTPSGEGRAFLSTAGIMRDLGLLPGGSWSSGYSVNSAGQVAGYGDIASGAFRAFSWTSAGGMTQLGTLGGANSYAMDVNDLGQIAGHAQTANGFLHAFVTSPSGMVNLGTLGGTSSFGYNINNHGAVVGMSTNAAGSDRAFLYQSGSMYDLNNLILSSGWILTAAYAINDAGQIAGAGLFGGVEHAFLLNPFAPPVTLASFVQVVATPEPASVALAGFGFLVVGLALRARARRGLRGSVTSRLK